MASQRRVNRGDQSGQAIVGAIKPEVVLEPLS
jgi:hypothetical protein